jgi:CheY-like chemotaxis protein
MQSALILVVDDSPVMLDLMRSALEEAGFRVNTCLRSVDAVRLAGAEPPDAILLDIVMPELSGWEVLAKLREDPTLAAIPVIVCTADVEQALGRLAELRGPSGHGEVGLVPKPFDLDELLEVVSSVTNRPPAMSASD